MAVHIHEPKPSEDPATEIGVVTESDGNIVKIRLQRHVACEACGSASTCFPTGGVQPLIEAVNEVGASVGDVVKLERAGSKRLGASFLVFGVPLIAMLIGTYVGYAASGENASDGSAVGALAGIALGMLLVHFISNLKSTAARLRPVAREIISHSSDPVQ